MGRGGQSDQQAEVSTSYLPLPPLQSDERFETDPQVSKLASLGPAEVPVISLAAQSPETSPRAKAPARLWQSCAKSWLLAQIWDLVVVGAGVAGCSLAFSQGKVSASLYIWSSSAA